MQNKETRALFKAILTLKNADECERFFSDVCTIREIEEMSSRFRIARMLSEDKPKSYAEIAKEIQTSTATVTRVAHWLHHGAKGYQLAIKRITSWNYLLRTTDYWLPIMMHLIYTPERQRIAIQKSGRLYQASMDFLISCGLSFPQNGKSLILESENFDIDLLFLRDDDIPEYVKRGVADFGIVGQNILAEKGIELPVVAKLDFGRCKLIIAASKNSRIRSPKDLGGMRIATSYPKLLSDYLVREGVEASIVPISGSTEITPELDLSDAICDLVQTGATLKAHYLVPLFVVMESQAVLIESPVKKEAKNRFLSQINLKSNLWIPLEAHFSEA